MPRSKESYVVDIPACPPHHGQKRILVKKGAVNVPWLWIIGIILFMLFIILVFCPAIFAVIPHAPAGVLLLGI